MTNKNEEPTSSHDAARPYSATRRTPRVHRRVVHQGTERFDADGVKPEPSEMQTAQQRQADDDKRILGELPPHWAVFENANSGWAYGPHDAPRAAINVPCSCAASTCNASTALIAICVTVEPVSSSLGCAITTA